MMTTDVINTTDIEAQRELQAEQQEKSSEYPSKLVDPPREEQKQLSSSEESQKQDEIIAEEAPSPRQIHGIKWILVILSILCGPFLYALDNTIVANIVPSIVDDLGQIDKLPWLSVGYLLGGVAVILPSGKLYRTFDAKPLYIFFTILFMAGSALCGGAPNMAALIVGRVITGIGGNGRYFGTVTILSANTSEKEKPSYLALMGAVYGIGTGIGPIIGGAFADSSASWRWGFYLIVIIAGVFTPIYAFLLPSVDPERGVGTIQRFAMFDAVGSILQLGVLVCIIMAINFGGVLYDWNSGQIIALFVLFGVILIVFVIQQYFALFTSAAARIFPGHLLLAKEHILLFIAMMCGGGAGFVVIYYVPLYLQFTRGFGSLDSGVRLLPFILTFILLILVNGGALSKSTYYKPWFIFGAIGTLVGGVLMSRLGLFTSLAHLYGYEVIMGVAIGCYSQGALAVIQAILEVHEKGNGVTLMMFSQLLGLVLALSVSGAVFVNTATNNLHNAFPDQSVADIRAFISGTSGHLLNSLSSADRTHALEIVVSSIQKPFIMAYTFGALALIASLLMPVCTDLIRVWKRHWLTRVSRERRSIEASGGYKGDATVFNGTSV